MSKEHITLRLDEELLKKIDALAKTGREDRSEVIAELLAKAVAPDPAPAPAPAPGGPADFPPLLKSRLDTLEQWSREYAATASRRELYFWLLTLPPIVINAGYATGLFASWGLAGVQSLGLFLSAILMLAEKERPQSRLYTAYERAFFELQNIIRAMTEQWQAGSAAGQDPRKLLEQILAVGEKEETRVSNYIGSAESYLKEASLTTRFKTVAVKQFAALGS